ncbi:MAG: RNA polymerase sporulation sigma factor SigK [Oscillospiraceae bacterium]|jgi:RNA polymerase sporulation-specific sigma factor|nr:RNA polymerase sporulation sigma factor SigK [Oscillospiraceae bacterium]
MFQMLEYILENMLYFALYILPSGSFPKPLPLKEEKECLELMKKGDDKAKNKFIEHNLRLVAHIIKKYYNKHKDQEDLISIGTIGLIKAAASFDSEKGIRFATYAARCIDNEILMYFRNQKKVSQDVYINDTLDTDKEGNSLTIMDVVADGCNVEEDTELKLKSEQLHKYIKLYLNNREKLIVEFRYGLNGNMPMTQREVSDILGISRSYVSRIEKKALQTLYRKFQNERLS